MPTVVPTDSRPLSCPPIGALPRNRLASSATGSASPISPTTRFAVPLVTPSVGADVHIGPPIGTSCYAFVGAGVPDGPFCFTSCNPSVGADAYIGPPDLAPHSLLPSRRRSSAALLVTLSLRTSDRCHWCGNPHPPSPPAPLPKGGCHGEAVTGGFLSPLHFL